MHKLFLFCFLSTIFFSCKNEPQSAQEIIDKAIKFHDPNNQWNSLNAKFLFESSFSFNDSVPEELHLSINNPQNQFTYKNLDRKVEIYYDNDSCEVISADGSCGGYSWTKNFYPYIWGLPMKLKDPGVTPESTWKKDTINGFNVYQVLVNYEAENFKFYFDQKDYQLRAFEFLKNDDSGKGEIIFLKDLFEFNGIKFPAYRKWMELNRELIGTNEVKAITQL